MTAKERSFAERLAEAAAAHPDGEAMLAETLGGMTPAELAAMADDWEHVWRRPKQTPPAGDWHTWGALTGRGFGKSLANARLVHREAESGRAMRIALIAQNEDKCLEVMVHGESGLVGVSPPWFKAYFENGRVVWPNGAQAFVYTPERPKDIFGPEHHLAWASELHAWPETKREEAFANLLMGLRLGYGRLVWDSNPRRRHPILKELLAEHEANPDRHVVVRGSSRENRLNLTRGKIEEWERKYGGTRRGEEMIEGRQFDDDEGALFEQEWIDRARREMPTVLKRRILSIDPAISMRAGTDKTGIVDLGLGIDDQVFVIEDLTAKLAWEAWGSLAVDRYIRNGCDCMILERNRGGDAVAANIKSCAQPRGIRMEIVKADAPTRHVPGVIYVKEVIGRDSKEVRAEPVAGLCKNGFISIVNGAKTTDLEETMTTWVPGEGQSPNDIDALVHGVFELRDLSKESARDGKAAVQGAVRMQAALAAAPSRAPANVAVLLGGNRGGDRI